MSRKELIQKHRSLFWYTPEGKEYYLVGGTAIALYLGHRRSIDEIASRAEGLFGELFSAKMFRIQLSFFDDVDYSEEVEYLISEPPSNQEIKSYLTEISTDILRDGNVKTSI